jgi:hypothetical protein
MATVTPISQLSACQLGAAIEQIKLTQPPKPTAADDIAIEQRGVSAKALVSLKQDILATFGEAANDMTTSDACNFFIKPLLQDTPSFSLLDAMTKQSPSVVIGRANRFVSHAWRYSFLQVLDGLIAYAEQQDDAIYFWLDVCCNNQHSATNLPYEWWSNTFSASIAAIGHTILLYGPWDEPVPLKRS